jgi:hypothetical protein
VVRLEVPPVADRYTWSEATGLITDEALPGGVFPDHADLYLVMNGPQRLESLRLIGD